MRARVIWDAILLASSYRAAKARFEAAEYLLGFAHAHARPA